jgi:cytochrome c-type biogenesis protein
MIETATIGAAFLAGALSFLSPCVLPLVPPYLTFLAGTTLDGLTAAAPDRGVRARAVRSALLFVLGFSTVFILLGMGASVFGQILRQHSHTLAMVSGVAIIIMGLHLMGVFRLSFLYREARFNVDKPAGAWGAYVMGLAFAFGWTPCIGPVLGVILAKAAIDATLLEGGLLLAIYSAGLGVPFLIAAFAMGPFVRFLKRMRSRLPLIEKVTGALLVLTGIGFLTGAVTAASFWLLETFPVLGTLG